MNPDAVHDAEREHDHERERSAVANERQGDAGDRQNGNRHPRYSKMWVKMSAVIPMTRSNPNWSRQRMRRKAGQK